MAKHSYIRLASAALAFAVATTGFAVTPARKPAVKSTTIEPTEKPADADSLTDPNAPRYGEAQTVRFRVGAEITAVNGACKGIVAMVSVPLECTEQKVTIVSEDFSPEVSEVTYRPVQGGEVKQMLISIPRLNVGATAHAILTTEVTTRKILPPEKTDNLTIPTKLPLKIKMYTVASPYIETNHPRIKALSQEIMKDVDESANDWDKVEAIYDAVLKKIDYLEGPDKGAVEALHDGKADCQGRSAVFVAVCRANKIPARMVWVQGHVYPEFYLEHADGEGFWYPCESAGTHAFGEMPLCRTILQKGDNFRVPERKEKLRYASDFLTGLPTPGGGKPKVHYIREVEPLSGAAGTQPAQQTPAGGSQ